MLLAVVILTVEVASLSRRGTGEGGRGVQLTYQDRREVSRSLL